MKLDTSGGEEGNSQKAQRAQKGRKVWQDELKGGGNMDKHAIWKWLTLIVLMAFSLVLVTPPGEKIRLGLDLKGGTRFVVEIDKVRLEEEIRSRPDNVSDEDIAAVVKDTLKDAQERAVEVIRNRVDNLGIAEPIIYLGQQDRIIIELPGIDEEKRKEAQDSIERLAFLEFRMVHEDNDELVLELFDKSLTPEGYRIVQVGNRKYYKRDSAFPDTAMDRAYHKRLGRFEVPDAAHEFMLQKDKVEDQKVFRPFYVKRRREFSGENLEDAMTGYQSFGQPVVNIRFDSKGSRKFADVTADYAPGGRKNPNPQKTRQLAIVLDGTLYSAPVINEAIFGGRAEISGSFTVREANFLSNILRAGSLPAPVKIVEMRSVEPSLGQDSIDSGMRAVVYGGLMVLAFMLVHYRLCGVIANLALILNMLLLPLGMIAAAGFLSLGLTNAAGGGSIQLPVLTLPGIAGILLTIGMAVDANVLIFERIREEFRTGKQLWSAVTAGYDRAFVTIMDANLTTLLTGIILFRFGSGPIRGFAVTLCAGIVVSMFTALVITKLFFGIIASKTNIKTLKMLSIIKDTSIDFISKRKFAAVISVALIVVSWGLLVTRAVKTPDAVFGVDFMGGSSMTFTFKTKQPVESIRATLAAAGIKEAHIQYQKEMTKDGKEFLQIKTGSDGIRDAKPIDIVKGSLNGTYPDSEFTMVQSDHVGPQIGKELKKSAVVSIILALFGIIVYISWRFELGFAIGAIVALTHDVLVTAGIYCMFDRQISLPIVAALLTIVGYSVNDTIVVFDRIRENLRQVQNMSFKDICNLSINQTLRRTVLTSLTTLITIVMLLIVGGGAINDFALALCIGVLVGTYSSIFVATPVVLLWHRDRKPGFAVKGKVK